MPSVIILLGRVDRNLAYSLMQNATGVVSFTQMIMLPGVNMPAEDDMTVDES